MPAEGVPLHQLRCPTCGALYEDFNMHSDKDSSYDQMLNPIMSAIIPVPWYLLCPNGHKWTVKTLWRAPNRPDAVLLDRFIGGP